MANKTKIIILDVSRVCSGEGLNEYGPYRFLTFCEKTHKLFSNYIQSAFGVELDSVEDGSFRDIHGRAGSWWIHPKIDQIDKGLLEMVFDKVCFIVLDKQCYDDDHYSNNGGYIGWLNNEIDLGSFFEEE